MADFDLTQAQPGDVLLYARTSLFNRIISVKTWSRFTHVEIAGVDKAGHVKAYASRNGVGVGVFEPDLKGLALVLRPAFPCGTCKAFIFAPAREWFYGEAIGQGYDWAGLLNFAYAQFIGRENRRMFCSEFATRFLRRGGFDPFSGCDADKIAPRDFSTCPCLTVIWRSADETARAQREVI